MTIPLFRALFGLACLLNFLISEFYRRKARAARVVVVERRNSTMYFIITMVWGPCLYGVILVTFAMPGWVTWAAIKQPVALHWLGAALALGSLPLTFWASRSLGSNLAGGLEVSLGWKMVMRGPYRRIRHPLYLAGTMFLAGLSFLSASLLVGAVSAAGIVLMRFMVIPKEERTLAETFGKTFETYRNRTGVWIPVQARHLRASEHSGRRRLFKAKK
jgi:protein-S-isoprenylcysteine O-methyltransferase Ste14